MLAASTLALTSFAALADPAQDFWKWFTKNQAPYYAFKPDDVSVREPLFDALSSQLRKIDDNLTFEFGPVESGKREFVISADGIKSSFPAVQDLVGKAPALPRWHVVAFRQRRMPVDAIEFEGISIDPRTVLVQLYRDNGKIGLTLYFAGYSDARSKAYGQAGYLLLDDALGEYDMETKVSFVEFKPLGGETPAHSVPVSDLAAAFDESYGK